MSKCPDISLGYVFRILKSEFLGKHEHGNKTILGVDVSGRCLQENGIGTG